MANFKNTKRALFSSAIALVLCFSMLLGTTFAWFTDSVTSSGNVIQTGTLEVEMGWAKGNENPASVAWKDASEGAIFTSTLWEPGFVEARHIKISNKGSLALKYQLFISANGEVSALSDVIDVYYADPAVQITDRAQLTDDNKIGTLTNVLQNFGTADSTAAGNLKAGESHTITLALKMREDAGNDYQNLSIGTDFNVVLMATQDNVENDSFGDNYDDIEIPEKAFETIGGNSYYTDKNGNFVLANVPYGNVGSTFEVPAGVTIIGQGDVYADAVPVFSKYSPITSITIPEGVTEIKSRAITGVKTLTSINFPSTLTAIREQALRQTGMTTLEIPENVEFIGSGAFRDMPNLTTVTIEGNVTLDNYVFRSCPNLTSIYLLGDDVTFTGGQFVTHSDNGDTTGLTIYVQNATVAARLIAAQSSAYGYEVKIGDETNSTPVENLKNDAAFDSAVASGAEAIVLAKGNYTLPTGSTADLRGKNLTVVGTKDTVIDLSAIDARDQFVTGANLVFDGVTLNFGTNNYMGFANTENLTYKNCTINGLQFLFGKNVTFENCVLNSNGAEHCIWTYGVQNVSFTGCEFTYGDRAINCYSDNDVTGGKQVVNFTDCTFATENTASKGAVEINSYFFSVGIEVNMTNCTAPAYGNMAYVSEWDTDGLDKTDIFIDGTQIE